MGTERVWMEGGGMGEKVASTWKGGGGECYEWVLRGCGMNLR